MSNPSKVIVIGAGIVGTSTAQHLLKRGHSVTLIDRNDAGKETSFGNSGIIETSYVLPFSLPPVKRIPQILANRDTAVHLHYRSIPANSLWILDFYRQSQPIPRKTNGQLLRPLISVALDEHLEMMRNTDAGVYLSQAGRVKLHRSEASFKSSVMERNAAEELGVPFRVMSYEEFHEIEPHLKPAYHKAVQWTSSARLTNPGAVVTAYAERFIREGGKFLRADVTSLSQLRDHSWNVTAGGRDYCAQNVVICSGPWSGELFKPLGYSFPLGIKRGYHQHFAAQEGATLRHAIVDADIGYLICPMEQGFRLTTGAEFADLHAKATPVQISRILPYARELFPLDRPLEAVAWLGARPCFTDSLPVIGKAPQHSGLWFNFGHGHSGLTIGPSSARLLAEMLSGEKTFCDPHPYRADRFTSARDERPQVA